MREAGPVVLGNRHNVKRMARTAARRTLCRSYRLNVKRAVGMAARFTFCRLR